MTAPAPRALWIGTYPAEGSPAGSGEGIWRVDVDVEGRFGQARLVAESPSPSFVALHPSGRTLYAVREDAPGAVSAFPVLDDGNLGAPVTLASGGTFPCHLLALESVLWIANYGDGVAAALALDERTGAFAAAAVTRFEGSGAGPQEDRQEGPHAHFAAQVGDDVLVVDLGADVIRRYPANPTDPTSPADPATPTDPTNPAGEPNEPGEPGEPAGSAAHRAATLPAGTGPRHLVALPAIVTGPAAAGALAVAGELDSRLHVLAPTGTGTWTPSSAQPATAAAADCPERRYRTGTLMHQADRSYPSHLSLDGDLLLLGVRGADVLAVHRVASGSDGTVVTEALDDVALGQGAWPRHHASLGPAADGRLLVVVAHQGTSELAALLVDPATGKGEIVDRLAFPTPPACVLEA